MRSLYGLLRLADVGGQVRRAGGRGVHGADLGATKDLHDRRTIAGLKGRRRVHATATTGLSSAKVLVSDDTLLRRGRDGRHP